MSRARENLQPSPLPRCEIRIVSTILCGLQFLLTIPASTDARESEYVTLDILADTVSALEPGNTAAESTPALDSILATHSEPDSAVSSVDTAAMPNLAVALPDSAALDLPDAKVKGKKREESRSEMRMDFIRKIPTTLDDPVRALSFLPGVAVQNDVNVRPFVRGGSAEQTQVVWEGMPMLQPYHLGGSFSTFNAGTLESVDLLMESLPVENPGALSGVLHLKPRRPAASEPRARGNLSLLRGDAFAEVPVLKDQASVYGGAQGFLFNESLHALLDLSSLASRDSLFQQDLDRYRNHINLPAFRDYHFGASYFGRPDFRGHYSGGLSRDDYTVVVPKQLNIVKPPAGGRPSNPGIPSVPVLPKKEIGRAKKLSMDSVSDVGILGQTHFLALSWDAGPRHVLDAGFGFQSQDWGIGFKKDASLAQPLELAQDIRVFSHRVMDTWSPREGQEWKFGWSHDYKRHSYRAELPYVLYEVILNGNLDMLEPLGFFSDAGFRIEKEDSLRSNFDYLGELPARIRFSHHGKLEEHFASAFYSHAWTTPRGRFTHGLRAEYHAPSGEFFPAPRLGYAWNLSERNSLGADVGLYSQQTLPFFQRDDNPHLRPEKAGHGGLQWTHRFGEGYRLSLRGYAKRYYDLVTPTLVPDGSIDLAGMLLPHPGSPLSEDEIARLRSILDTIRNFSALPDSIRQPALATFGGLEFAYANAGEGHAFGTELSLFYRPHARWNGWISADFSRSERRDGVDRPYYPYRYHRPVIVNWVNYFDMPSQYDIAFTYRWAMGQPYTPYSGTLDGTGSADPIWVGARNSGRLAPYSRLDMRLSRSGRWLGAGFKTYIEVWNSMNAPNYFGRDDGSGQLKSAQLNWPFPLFFVGVSAEL